MTKHPAYRLQQVCKRHNESFALRVDQLEIATGEVFCLLGPTGAGKSTLLRLVSGIELPTSGGITFQDRRLEGPITPLSVLRQIAMVHQQPLVLTGTVRFNVEYGLRVRGVGPSSSKVEEILERLGLGKLAGQSARTLSGGQVQLVALARALVLESDVLLLDEPTTNLDPARVALAEEAILEAQGQRKVTVVWATHNLFQARRVGHEVGLLLNGSLVEVAPTRRFFENPTDERTAQFVQGKMVY
jgi:tungstate transport system ATP-binding protein